MRYPLEWVGADLSATTYTKWVRVPPQAKRACINIGWTATAAPTGTLAIQVSGHGTDGTAGAAYSPAPAVNPAGGANTAIFDNIVTADDWIRMVYTAGSGGTGATFTSDTGVAGTVPSITFKE